MSIIVNKDSKVLIQGITGNVGMKIAEKMINDKTNLLCGVTPGKGGQKIYNIPIFNSIKEALAQVNVDICFSVVSPPFIKDAIFEALYYGIKKIVVYTEGVPLQDSYECVYYAKMNNAMLLGPNSAGVVSPEEANVSDLNSINLIKGNIGIVSKSGTITYEIIEGLRQFNLGCSTIVCLGGDPIVGTNFSQILNLFNQDNETKAIILLGEIGGNMEIEAIPMIKNLKKPIFLYISGHAVPEGKQMGHAGAIVNKENDSAFSKSELLKNVGANVAKLVIDIPKMVAKHFKLNKDVKR